jgi:carbon monoxide dehydrogenase subunit G
MTHMWVGRVMPLRDLIFGSLTHAVFTFQVSLTIRRPREAVLDLLTRFEDIPKFVPQVDSAEQTSSGPIGVGTTFVQRGHLLGRRIETPTRVTVHDPPHRFGYQAAGVLPYTAYYRFIALPEGTRLDVAVSMQARGLLRLLEPLLAWQLPKLYRANLHRMRQLLESGAENNRLR